MMYGKQIEKKNYFYKAKEMIYEKNLLSVEKGLPYVHYFEVPIYLFQNKT